MKEVRIELPSSLADEAARAGLLAPAKLAAVLRSELRRERVEGLFEAMDKLAGVTGDASMTPEDVAAEIAAMRADRRNGAR